MTTRSRCSAIAWLALLAPTRTTFAQSCLTSFTFEADPPPIDGHYATGQTVMYCFSVLQWNEVNVNWLHGVVPSFGPGWDTASFMAGVPPLGCGLTGGSWTFADSVTGTSAFNVGPQGPGWFFDLDNDGDPGNNLGDDCSGPWTFCFSITVKDSLDCEDGADLGVSANSYGDSETGSWDSPGCGADTVPTLAASALCSLSTALPAISALPLPFRVYPTQFSDAFTVQNAGPAGELLLFDPTGRLVRALAISARSEQAIARGALPAGIYRIIFEDGRTGQRRCAGTLAAQ